MSLESMYEEYKIVDGRTAFFTSLGVLFGMVIIYMDKGSDALGACFASVLSAMACFVEEFDE